MTRPPASTDGGDRLYLDLKGARERLCRAQTHLGDKSARLSLGQALDDIDRVGAVWCPDQWSRFDQPAFDQPAVARRLALALILAGCGIATVAALAILWLVLTVGLELAA